jgi:hypothetical protein
LKGVVIGYTSKTANLDPNDEPILLEVEDIKTGNYPKEVTERAQQI